ncbi:MAG: VCBS repeat-containing protein, partial [Planctomycetota bacterium]
IQRLRGPMEAHLHAKIKVTSMRLFHTAEERAQLQSSPGWHDEWSAGMIIEVGGHDGDRGWHATATLASNWHVSGSQMRLEYMLVEAFESTELKIDGGRLFEDVTAAVLGEEPAWTEQLLVGQDRWARTIEERLGMGLYKHSGVAIGDANGDGREDIYLAQPAGLPNLLLLKDQDGALRNASAAAGVDWLDHTSSALFADLDADGDLDLAACVAGTVLVHENTGPSPSGPATSPPTPRFIRRVALSSGDTDLYGLSAADVDGDGDLDLYVTADFASRRDRKGADRARFDYVDANDGGRNVLWRNDSEFRFVDATEPLGLDVHNRRHSLAATWRDIDRDGDVDLYVANDYGQNCLYLNRSERGSSAESGQSRPLFEECAEACGVMDRGSGMSIDVGDTNRDGRLDLFVANMWSSAGRRIVPQAGFGAAATTEQREQFSRFAKGNTLFTANVSASPGDAAGTSSPFIESSAGRNVERGRWAWGSPLVDIDGDGWEDMLVGNGYVTSWNSGDL